MSHQDLKSRAQMRKQAGFTLIEVMIAMVILVIIASSVARFSAVFSKAMTNSSIRVVASRCRLRPTGAGARRPELHQPGHALQLWCVSDTTGFPGYPCMRRTTKVVRDQTGSPARDLTTVTVRVFDPGLKDTVALTAVIASP